MRPGVRYMLLSALAFGAMTACVKWTSVRIPVAEIVFARALVSLVLSWLLLRRGGGSLLGRRRWLLLLRGLFGFAGLHCVFFAVSRLPLAEATVLQYLHPVFTAVLAALVLREAPGRGVLPALSRSSASCWSPSRASRRQRAPGCPSMGWASPRGSPVRSSVLAPTWWSGSSRPTRTRW